MTHQYDDIIGLPHHQSEKRKHMSLHDRAAQFAPFAALTGYEDAVCEAGRLTDREIFPEESDLELLDRKLKEITEKLEEDPGSRPEIRALYFIPDEKKAGGKYEEISGRVRRVDPVGRQIRLEDRRVLLMANIVSFL